MSWHCTQCEAREIAALRHENAELRAELVALRDFTKTVIQEFMSEKAGRTVAEMFPKVTASDEAPEQSSGEKP